MRKGITLKRNDHVVAGQQIGWTASSGNSSWPHLHFTTQVASEIDEPFSGPCNEGSSGWVEQAAMPSDPYVRDLALSEKPFTGKAALPDDRARRSGAFVAGTMVMHVRLELGVVDAGMDLRIRFVRPDGSDASQQTAGVADACRLHASLVTEDPDFEIVRYRYRWSVDGKVVRAVQSAALSDVLRKGVTRAGKSVRCAATPTDDRLAGPTAAAAGTAR